MSARSFRLPPRPCALLLALALPILLVLDVRVGSTGEHDLATSLQGVAALLGFGEPLSGPMQTIVELRLWRALTAAGVGAALALSGALVQGLFRNGLAAPSILGVTGGASLGATLAILALSGYAPALVLNVGDVGTATLLVPLFGFIGALTAVVLVTVLASPGGRVSVPTLLLTGIAVNTCIAGVLSLISWMMLDDWEVSKAVLRWTFGTLDDRTAFHAATVGSGLLVACLAVPFVAWELDLFAGGEQDARALGVSTGRVRAIAIAAAALSAAAAVSVAGQIAFVGLVVPHVVRQLTGTSHRSLLPLSVLAGAVFLLGVDVLQRALLGDRALQPGVMMSLVGGPFFLVLLAANRREVESW